jgi:hypothetical protein
VGEDLVLKLEGHPITDVELQHSPSYYDRTLANGKPIIDIAPTIEWGYLLYLTVFRLCQYFGAQEECQFCDINENYHQQKKAGRPYTSVKSVGEVLEALARPDEGKELNLEQLKAVAARVTEYYRERGYILAYAYLPPQDVREGVIEIAILEAAKTLVGVEKQVICDDLIQQLQARIGVVKLDLMGAERHSRGIANGQRQIPQTQPVPAVAKFQPLEGRFGDRQGFQILFVAEIDMTEAQAGPPTASPSRGGLTM